MPIFSNFSPPPIIDKVAPTVTGMALNVRGAQGTMVNAGDVIEITVNMSEASYLSGTSPWVNLNIGGAVVQAMYAGGAGSSALRFTYTVERGQSGAISLGANSLMSGSLSDAAGNKTTTSYGSLTNFGYMVDTTAPTTPVINAVATDNILKAAEVGSAISGIAEAGSTIRLTLDGSANVRTVVSNAGGAWTYALSTVDIAAMGQGARTISATATDVAGNVSAATTRTITIDTVAPTAPVINAVATDNTVNAAEMGSAISGRAEAGSTIRLTLGSNANVRTVVSNASGAWTYALSTTDIAAMGQGVRTISATATDVAGNVSAATTRAITIDTVAPTAPVINAVATDNIVKAAEVGSAISGMAEVGSTIRLTLDGSANVRTAVAIASGAWTYALSTADIAAMGQGARTISATATDVAGNVSAATTRAITIDTVAPTVIITDNVTGTANLAKGPVTYTFAFSEAVTGFAANDVVVTGGSKGAFTAISNKLYTLVVDPNTNASSVTVDVAAGVATDTAGNSNTAAIRSVQAVDLVAPRPIITDGVSGVATGLVTYTFAFSEAVSGFDAADVTVVGGLKSTFTALSASLYTLVVKPTASLMSVGLAAGVAQDLAGNGNVSAAASQQEVAVSAFSPVFTSIRTNTGATATVQNGGSTKDNTLEFYGTAVAGSVISIYEKGVLLGKWPMENYTVANPDWSITPLAFGYGVHDFQVKMSSDAGIALVNYSVTIVPTRSFSNSIGTDKGATSSIAWGGVTTDHTLKLSGEVEVDSRVQIYDKGDYMGDAEVSNTTWTFMTPALLTGSHAFSTQITDRAGNSTSIQGGNVSVMPDLLAAGIRTKEGSTPSISSGGFTKDNTLELYGTVTLGADSKVGIYQAGVLQGYAELKGREWSFTTKALNEGTHNFQVKADSASLWMSATVDTTAAWGEFGSYITTDTGALDRISSSEGHTSDHTLGLSGSMEAGSTVKVYDNGAYIGTADTSASTWTFMTPKLADGQHLLSIVVTDQAGNGSQYGKVVDVYAAPAHEWSTESGWGSIDALAALNAVTTGKMLIESSESDAGHQANANFDDAWYYGYTGKKVTTGEKVVIAVLDSGLDLTNKDLTQNLSKWNWNFVNNNGDVSDDMGHGTFVAGEIIAADNSFGFTGAAYDSELMVLKVMDAAGGGVTKQNSALAIKYAVDHGADVINMSFGGPFGDSPDQREALIYARDHNVVVVAGAGNSGGGQPVYPAHSAFVYDNMLAVGALQGEAGVQSLAGLSNRAGSDAANPYGYVAAAGVQVLGYTLGSALTMDQGTSMATPYVSSLAAILLSANPSLSAAQVVDVISHTSHQVLM